MKTNHCQACPKYHCCVKICRLVFIELKRIEKQRRKHRIEIISESDMTGPNKARWDNCIYGTFEGE